MVLLEMLTIIAGIFYGYFIPGKEDRFELFKNGIIIGVILGFVSTILGSFLGIVFLIFGTLIGFIAFLEVIVFTILFIIGTYIGDWLEEISKSREEKAKRRDDKPWK